MNIELESPLFPTPVRWFEIPMNTARSGFALHADKASSDTIDLLPEASDSKSSETAKLLDEHV